MPKITESYKVEIKLSLPNFKVHVLSTKEGCFLYLLVSVVEMYKKIPSKVRGEKETLRFFYYVYVNLLDISLDSTISTCKQTVLHANF